ncbi:putative carbohydrate esterase [Nicotiana attenuata]|uniref:Carbohydrate esterase n=1 Tax=Nicotiana attenuata TaxID=49451 RepID=A0A1J6J3A6_NICAT|nr:putative carbohydrate esterase [Nicotiana attenuata]
MHSLLFLMYLVHTAWVATANVTNGCASEVKNIFILSGQSNMSGRGGVFNQTSPAGMVNLTWGGVVPPECQPNPSIVRLSAELKWAEAKDLYTKT